MTDKHTPAGEMAYEDGLDNLTDLRDEVERLREDKAKLLEALKAIYRVAETASLPGPVYLSIAEVEAARDAIKAAKGDA